MKFTLKSNLTCNIYNQAFYCVTQVLRVFIRHRRSENSLSTTQNSPAKFCLFPERALLFHDNCPTTLPWVLYVNS